MDFRIRKYLGCLLFLAVSVSAGAQVIHSFLHLDTDRCTAKEVHHLHEAVHHCRICDDTTTPSDFLFHYSHTGLFYPNGFSTIVASVKSGIQEHTFHLHLRGPPVTG